MSFEPGNSFSSQLSSSGAIEFSPERRHSFDLSDEAYGDNNPNSNHAADGTDEDIDEDEDDDDLIPSIIRDLESGINVTRQDSFTPNPGSPEAANMNLNMLSAVVHVGGDTLRTFAIFGAALFSSTTNFPSALCDAWAAVIVTVTVVFLVIPLIKEIWKGAFRESS